MSEPRCERHQLDEIESRQDMVLKQIDELNARVEGLLKDCTRTTADRSAAPQA